MGPVFSDIKAVIFDLGETLCTRAFSLEKQEEMVTREISRLLIRVGHPAAEKFYRELKDQIWKDWKENAERSGLEFQLEDFWGHLLQRTGIPPGEIPSSVAKISEIIYRHDLENVIIKPTVAETLQQLRRGEYLQGLISNSSYSYDHILRILEKLKIKDFLDVVLVSSREGIAKPNQLIFKKALSLLQVEPGEAVFIGDNLEVDILGAKSVGMRTILVSDEEIDGSNLAAAPPSDRRIKFLKDLLPFLPPRGKNSDR